MFLSGGKIKGFFFMVKHTVQNELLYDISGVLNIQREGLYLKYNNKELGEIPQEQRSR